jgi:hypothetical protein
MNCEYLFTLCPKILQLGDVPDLQAILLNHNGLIVTPFGA